MYYVNKEIVTLRVSKHRMINYCYLVIDPVTRDALAIDPAWELDTVLQALEERDAVLRKIFVTHHHGDHLNLAVPLAEMFDLDIVMSQEEVDTYGVAIPHLETFSGKTFISAGSLFVQTLPTPGHTAGSTCYLVDNNLFTGDTLFNEGCGVCVGKGADPSALYQSLNMLKRYIPADTRVFPGHRFSTELGQPFSELLRYNMYLCMPDEATFRRFRMRDVKDRMFAFI